MFKCEDCDMTFQSAKVMEKHRKTNSTHIIKEQVHQCGVCEKVFEHSYLLRDHQTVFGHKPLHRCKVCNMTFAYVKALENHVKLNHTDPQTQLSVLCEKCGESFLNISRLQAHILIHNEKDKPFKCSKCGEGLSSAVKLKKHVSIHRETFRCDVCDLTFPQLAQLLQHSLIHTRRKKQKCRKCGMRFVSASNFLKHECQPFEEIHKCEVCGEEFEHRTLLLHHQTVLKHRKLFKCEKCSNSFTYKTLLQKHMDERHSQVERPHLFNCDQCDKSFPSLTLLKGHITAHTYVHRCEVCGQSFKSFVRLKKHKAKYKHQKIQRCEKCGKEFIQLTIHLKKCKFELVKPDLPNDCSDSYNDARRRRRVKQPPKEKKLHRCEECGKGFVYAKALEKHLTCHIALEKPYPCNDCSECFDDGQSLQEHINEHHNQREDKQDPCNESSSSTTSTETVQNHFEDGLEQEKVQTYVPNKSSACSTNCEMPHNHMESDLDSDQRVQTHPSGESSTNKETVQDPMEVDVYHEKIQVHACNECGACFSSEGSFLKHFEDNHMSCIQKESSIGDTREESFPLDKRHVDVDDQQHHCNKCGVFFPSQEHLVMHLEECHIKQECDQPYESGGCHTSEETPQTRQRYSDHHHGDQEEQLHSCDRCGSYYLNEEALHRHFADHHIKQEVQPYQSTEQYTYAY